MKRKKEYSVFAKIRPALRQLYRYSPMRREALKEAILIRDVGMEKEFRCPICQRYWPMQMAEVDHQPPLGSLQGFKNCTLQSENLGDWAERLFFGSVRVICKICHKKITAKQRKKK